MGFSGHQEKQDSDLKAFCCRDTVSSKEQQAVEERRTIHFGFEGIENISSELSQVLWP